MMGREKYSFLRQRIGVFVLLLPILLGVSASAEAHRKTDIITLYNGDRITGEIKSLLSGRLSLGTDSMGTLNIEWKDVSSIDSNFNYELRLASGERFFGSPSPSDKPGVVNFSDVFGERSLSWMEIVELRPIEKNIRDRIDIYLSANYSFTKASDVAQTEFRADASYEDEQFRNSITSRATISDTETETTHSSKINVSRQGWTDRQSFYRLVFGGYETNDELALDYRLTLGGGVGRYFSDSNNSKFYGSVSIQGLEERSSGGESQQSAEGVLSLSYSRWRFDTPERRRHGCPEVRRKLLRPAARAVATASALPG